MTTILKATDVFTPGGYPSVTFVDSHTKSKKGLLLDTLAAGSLVVSLSGPSKSGKTVFIEEAIGKGLLVHVTGAGVTRPELLWNRIFAIIGTPISVTDTSKTSGTVTVGGKTEGSVGLSFFAGAKVEASGSTTGVKESASTEGRAIDYQSVLVKELSKSGLVLFIDDFHYIQPTAQQEVAETIKEIVRQGVRVIVAAVPYRADDPLRANADLRGRSVAIDFGYWDAAALCEIPARGFRALNVDPDGKLFSSLAAEAAGSPQLMQGLCLTTCFEAELREWQSGTRSLPGDDAFFRKVCARTAMMANYRTVVDKMKEGPKTRGTDRRQYRLANGKEGDVYHVVLEALASDPPQLTTRYASLLDRIRNVCSSESPTGSSVAGACEHLATIANAVAGEAVVEWDVQGEVFDIRDPYLLFFIRWNEFPDHR